MRRAATALGLASLSAGAVTAFAPAPPLPPPALAFRSALAASASSSASASASVPAAAAAAAASLPESVDRLKKVLEREYTSFFDPMRKEYYAPGVTFEDPMIALNGVDAYQGNVDMLASRTLMGKVLFKDAGIVLHKVVGGEISDDGSEITDIVTRWTLRMTVKALPWSPTARFSGVSIYKVRPTPELNVGVQIVGQTDYWDSVNIAPDSGGEYVGVDKGTAISDFLDQLKPGGFTAATAAPELPYQLLRRGDGYEVRQYPAYTGVKIPYNRRDEGFGSLGAFTRGMNPLAPAVMEVEKSDVSDKYMLWPLTFAPPGSSDPPAATDASEKAGEGQWRTVSVATVPTSVVAVREFSDASMEPVVRKADRELRGFLKRDGLEPADGTGDLVRFAQYDAIFSMGKRRGEVWIDLKVGGHPW